jgi:hypothetical protein
MASVHSMHKLNRVYGFGILDYKNGISKEWIVMPQLCDRC